MNLQFGEIVLVPFQFHQAFGSKLRPAVVLLDTGDDDFVAAPVTSSTHHSVYDVPLADWAKAGLRLPSTVRIHKLVVRAKADVKHLMGDLSDADRDLVKRALRRAFCGTGMEK